VDRCAGHAAAVRPQASENLEEEARGLLHPRNQLILRAGT
jgi:hypothetical protein